MDHETRPADAEDSGALARLAAMLAAADQVVVLTGAGMSAESGLPTFRDANGMFTVPPIDGVPVEVIASTDGFRDHFPQYLKFYRMRIRAVLDHAPHDGHRMLARWQERGLVRTVITQNVDGYHQLAGSRGVLELHGSMRVIRCDACADARPAVDYLEDDGTRCGCGANLRPGIVMFGEAMPQRALNAAFDAAAEADLFLVIGTTLLVHPAAILPELARRSGAGLAIINLGETPLDDVADVVVRQRSGEALRQLDELLGAT